MVTIKLFCAAGMSTSMLVSRMRKAAEAKGVEAHIEAFPEGQLAKHLEGLDVALLGPQVGYVLPKAKAVCEPAGVPVAVIPTVDYGMMNGEKVLDFALKLIESKK
ncbi:MAG: PTS sugar transporter subunit IIB [Clostridiaceae bacterium]